MKSPKPVFKIRIVVLLIALGAGMTSGTEGITKELIEDTTETHSPGSSGIRIPEADFDSEPLVLARRMEQSQDQEELLDLLSVLEEETEIATKTKMNNDYVPGMVTMLQGEELEALGIHTVAEALAMVPGIQLARLDSGEPVVKVRGIAFPFNAGNVKVMLNSIALSRETSGINSSVLLTPVAQIDRIEVIRGPGSSIYGDFAMGGVINIITRNSGGRVFTRAGDDESLAGGGHYSYRDEEHSLGLGLNISMIDDGKNATAVDRDPDEERFTGVFNLDYKNFSFTAEGVRRNTEKNELIRTGPPPVSGAFEGRDSQMEESWAIEGRQFIEINPEANLEAYLSFLQNNQVAENPRNEFMGDRVETGLDLNWLPWTAHQLHFGLSYTYSDIDNAKKQMPDSPSLEVSGIERRNFSLGIQDMIALSDRFSLTLGLRYDDYDDVGHLLSPRIAGVYRVSEHQVVKAQYSEGFRAPTFWELYQTGSADDNLDFEVIETTELAYIYRRPKAVGRVTFYYSEINDGLYRYPPEKFGNNLKIDSKGVEVEWDQQINDKFRWLANISYNDTWDGRYAAADNESLGVADWLANLTIFLQPIPKLMITGHLLHVGDRHAVNDWIDGYDIVNLTISRIDFLQKGLTLRGGVKNIFDDTVIYLAVHPTSINEDEYQDRTWWLQLSYDF